MIYTVVVNIYALSVSSKNSDWIENGISFFNAGKYNEAIQCYDKALAIDPYYIHALNNKGYVLRSVGEYKEAMEYFDKALAIDPYSDDALYNKGLLFISLGKYKEAMECFDKALAIDPNNIEILTNKGASLHKLLRYSWLLINWFLYIRYSNRD
jgi:tetratricopeptide (TPR) repeat protein